MHRIEVIRNKGVIATLLLILLAALSCKKFVDIPPPVNETVGSTIFTDDATAISAVTGIYSDMMGSSGQFSSAGITLYAGMSADELVFFSPSSRDEFIRNDITEANHALLSSNFWDKAYKFIYTANVCLEGLEKSTQLSDSIKTMLTGECKFIRAFCYFHLVNLFGPVPLPLTSDYKVNAVLPRSSENAVYSLISDDLQNARDLLTDNYPNGRVRPNKWAAAALLARVHLYKGSWDKAESEATKVIGSSSYVIEPILNNVFLQSSREAIWQLLPINQTVNATWEGNLIVPAGPGVLPTYLLTDTLMNSFEPNDQRKTNWTRSRVVAGQTRYYPFKYKLKIAPPPATEYYMVLRLAEQYLIRAEARANQNKLQDAIADINVIRNRAGLSNTTASTQQELLAAIEQERKVELFAEWGHRWYDLKRTNRADEVLGPQKKPLWQSTDVLWPIPSSQLKINPALVQNQGY